MKKRSRLIIAAVAAITPTSMLRRLLLNALLSYKIDRTAYIAPFTIIAVANFSLGSRSRVGMFNVFLGPADIKIGSATRVGRGNYFHCSAHIADPKFSHMGYKRSLQVGDSCLVMNSHFFDLYGSVIIGDGTWIAGIRAEFWTHGLSVIDRDIQIGERNYVGSGAKFSPGSAIGSDNVVGVGSILTSKLNINNSLIAGVPAKPLRDITAEKAAGKYRFTFDDWD